NVAGYLSADLGVGAVGRLMIEAAQAVGVPLATHDHGLTASRRGHRAIPTGDRDWRYDVNVLCANADALPGLVDELGADAFSERRTVGIWHWEAEQFPDRF